jgi:GAF domain-containing protein
MPEEAAAFVIDGVRAYIAVPLVKDGAWIAVLAVQSIAPRAWTADEVALVDEVTRRTWAVVERARAMAALRATQAEYRERAAELQAVLESMSDGVYIGNLDGITMANHAALDQLGFHTPRRTQAAHPPAS